MRADSLSAVNHQYHNCEQTLTSKQREIYSVQGRSLENVPSWEAFEDFILFITQFNKSLIIRKGKLKDGFPSKTDINSCATLYRNIKSQKFLNTVVSFRQSEERRE
jgi:hypothetical protein